jgi:hypothetical protein
MNLVFIATPKMRAALRSGGLMRVDVWCGSGNKSRFPARPMLIKERTRIIELRGRKPASAQALADDRFTSKEPCK